MKLFYCALLLALASPPPAPAATTADDGELVYRNNCGRCHTPIHTFSPRMIATVTHHMQVKANLTLQERDSVLQYLLQTVDSRKTNTAKAKR